MAFKEKIQSLTAKEIILFMVEGLKNPEIEIDMCTFGDVKVVSKWLGLIKKRKCFGCAATNTICKITGVKFTEENIVSRLKRAEALGTHYNFLDIFEESIDMLRLGKISDYNYLARLGNFSEIEVALKMPVLINSFTQIQLQCYVNLANAQR